MAKTVIDVEFDLADLADRLVRCLLAGTGRYEPLGLQLPGLALDGADDIPDRWLSASARKALLDLELRTWDDLARTSPAEILGLCTLSARTQTEILYVAVEHALLASPQLSKAATPTEGASGGPEDATARGKVDPTNDCSQPDLLSALRPLASWGTREKGLTTLEALLTELIRPQDMPADIAEAWQDLASAKLADLVDPPAEDESVANLFEMLISCLDERQRAIFVARSLLPHRSTLQELAEYWGLTSERIRQLQGNAESKVSELVAKKRFSPLRWRAHSLRILLGSFIPLTSHVYLSAIEDLIAGCPPDRQLFLTKFILFIAGYYERDGWIVRDDATMVNFESLQEAADDFGLVNVCDVEKLLLAAGVAQADHAAMLAMIGGVRRFDDRIALWRGSAVDKAVRVLAVRGNPASPDELAEAIGEGHSVRALRNRLSEDPRLARVTKNEWALRAWGLDEYAGIADEIAEEVGRQGGAASLAHLVEALTSRFGIAETSVRAYAQTPRFVVDGGVVRLRRLNEPVVVSAEIGDAKGCFQDSPDSLLFNITVDKELLRGSRRLLPNAVAAFVGLVPGAERQFRISPGDDMLTVVTTWPVNSLAGPTLGSIRALALQTGASEGDLLRLRFDRAEGSVEVVRVNLQELKGAVPLAQLSLLTGLDGIDSTNAIDRVAVSVGVDRSRLRAQLHHRGDGFLVGLLPAPQVDANLEEALAELGHALAPK